MSKEFLDRMRRSRITDRELFAAHDHFDSTGKISYGVNELVETICNEKSPCCGLLRLYAKLGLHCYNFLQGENYELGCVKKYNYVKIFLAVGYYITMDAMDPATSLLRTVQTKVREVSRGQGTLEVGFNHAKLPAENKIPPLDIEFSFNELMLEWPTKNPFKNTNRYYMVKNSELQDNKWIHLYLEVAVALRKERSNDPQLSDLKIVKVAIEDQNERLNAKNVVLFISYRDNFKARILQVRRNYNEETGFFSVVGNDKESKFLAKKWRKYHTAKRRRRFGILNPLRLSSPRQSRASPLSKGAFVLGPNIF